jgi:hypothetical protein
VSTTSPITFTRQEVVALHRSRVADQVDEWVTEAVNNLVAAKKLCEAMKRNNLVKTERQRETLDGVHRIIQSALEAGHVPMLQYSYELLNDFSAAFADEDEDAGGDNS